MNVPRKNRREGEFLGGKLKDSDRDVREAQINKVGIPKKDVKTVHV